MEPDRLLPESIEKAKRQAVPAACQHCRSKRTKCNGEHPCAACAKRGIECIYVTKPEENETRQQAHKRKFAEISQAHHDLQRIYEILADRKNEHRALDAYRRIRNGQTPDTILRELRQADEQRPVNVTREQQLRHNFLMLLAQSTATLDEVKAVAEWAFSPQSSITLPAKNDCKSLLDSTISLGDIAEILCEINPHLRRDSFFNGMGIAPRAQGSPKETDLEPKYWVPARPWTELMDSDSVSQLVSVFFALPNTSWRFVEQHPFLHDMRSGDLNAQYCSPLLLHSILALASQYSEIDVALTQPGNLATRGERFHREAIRLWHLEEGKGSITNMQALNIIHLDATLRGKETLAGTLLASAVGLWHSFLDTSNRHGVMSAEETRIKRILAATTICMELIFHFTLLARSTSFTYASYDALNLDEMLPDTIIYWTAGDFRREPIPYHNNLQLTYRCRLATLLKDVCEALLSHESQPEPAEFTEQTGDLAIRLRQWYSNLPRSLHYDKDMPWGLYELHAEYLCITMTLHIKTSEILFADSNPSSNRGMVDHHKASQLRDHLRHSGLQYACRAASVARDFRKMYGLKIITPFITHAMGLACFILTTSLQQLAQQYPSNAMDPQPEHGTSISELESAFEECFRCMLSASMQHTYPRAVVRMIHRAAAALKYNIPESALQMLQMLNDNSWGQLYTDDDEVVPDGQGPSVENGKPEMEDLLKRWEEMGLQDKGKLLSGDDEVVQSNGSDA